MSRLSRLWPLAAITTIVLATAAQSAPALASVGAPTITVQPGSVDLYQGQNAAFTAAASGSPTPTVTWEVSVANGPWAAIAGITTGRLTVSHVNVALSGNRYRAVFSNNAGKTDSRAALLTVAVARLAKVMLSPATASIAPGGSATYHAEGFDPNGVDLGDVTSTTTFSIAPAGACSGAICTPFTPGAYTVTGTNGRARGTAGLTVTTANAGRLVLSPAGAWIAPGGSATFSAEAYDSAGDDLGNVTASTAFSINGITCDGATCSSIGGAHTVTGTYQGATGTAALTVVTNRFVELLFSRTEETAADNCVRDDTDIALLDTTVAPYLQSLGFSATGSIETGPTQQSSLWCTHYQSTYATSWNLAQALASTYGWTFVSHSATYPTTWPTDPGEQWDQTCGSAQVIDAHGLPGSDAMFAWPHNQLNSTALTQFVEPCFGTSRVYRNVATDVGTLSTPPYSQDAWQLIGGCLSATTGANRCGPVVVDGSTLTYQDPKAVINAIEALPPGRVLTLQAYLLVTGKSPPYTADKDQWDCTSTDPADHWSNDAERYCYSDFMEVMQALHDSGITITQPLAVDAAFGRTAFSDMAVPRP